MFLHVCVFEAEGSSVDYFKSRVINRRFKLYHRTKFGAVMSKNLAQTYMKKLNKLRKKSAMPCGMLQSTSSVK